MKRFLLLGILLFAYGSIFSQKISKPTRNPSIVCVETEMEIKFVVTGTFGLDSKFEILISDVSTDFSNSIKLGEVPYEVGKTRYDGIYSVAGVPVDKYYIKVVSTNPSSVESKVSKEFSVVENDPVYLVPDGPTEFCEGGGVTLVTKASFDDRFFEWYRVSSPNDDYLGKHQELRVEETGEYYAVSVVGSCTEKSNIITVVETIAPVSLITESDQEVCYPDEVVFTASSTDIEKPYYEWLDENGVVKHVGDTFTTNVAGTYVLRTTNYGNISPGGGCADDSDPVTLTVYNFEAQISETGPIKECSGTSITLNSTESNADYIYNWKRDGVILPDPISGKGKTSYTFTSQESDSGNYTLEIISPVCTKESSPALVIDIKDSPTPSIVEGDQKGCEGVSVTLTSGFDDLNNDYSYQWYLGNNPVSGAQSKSLDVIIGASTQGDYFLEMSFANCTVKSAPANVKMVKTPVSLMLPEGEAIACETEKVTLTAASENTENVTYSWIDSNDVEVGTGNKFITDVPGDYRLITINDGACDDISPVTTVIISPKAESKIKNTPLLDCELVVLEAESDLKGADPARVIYKWYKDAEVAPIQEGSNPILNVYDSGDYKLETLNYGQCGDITAPVTVAIYKFEAKIVETGPIQECSGSEITLTSAETDPNYIYNWKLNGTILPDPVSGKGKSTYTFTSQESDSGNYTLEIISPACTKESTPALVVDIKDSPIPSIVEGDQKGCEGVSVTLTSGFDDTNNIYSYQWYLGNNPVSGAQSKSLDVIIDASTQGDYFLEMSFANCTVKSAPANVKMVKTPVSLMLPEGEAIACETEKVTLTAVSENTENVTYSWIDSNDVEVGTGNQLITNVPGDYRLVTINDGSCEDISPVTTVIISPIAKSKIKNTTLLDCELVVLEAESDLMGADPARVIYNWYKDADPKPIQEGSDPILNVYDSGEYKLETLNYGKCGDVTAAVTVVINDLDPSIDEPADPLLVCVNSDHTLKAVESDPTYMYIWYRELVGSGVVEEVQNSHSPTFIINGTNANVGEWDYTLRVISPECDKTSTAISVIIPALPIAEISPDVDQTVCSDITLKSVGSNPGANITYQWFKDGSEIALATDVEYVVTADGDYYFKVYNYNVCESTSKTVNVDFVDFEHGIAEGDVVKECEEAGQFMQLTSINTDAKYSYRWLKDSQEVGTGMVLDIERLIANSGQYTLEVSEGGCVKTSDPIDVMILGIPVSVITSSSSKYCEGDSFQIESQVTDEDYDYTWYYNEIEITSTTSGGLFEGYDSPSLTVTMDNATVGDYQVQVSVGHCGGNKSPKVNMGMFDKFNTYVDVYPGAVLCSNGTITLTVTASHSISKYTWTKNGEEITGATESNYDVTSPGTYVVTLESSVSGCSQSADEVVITSAPDMGVVEDVIDVNIGETATFEAYGGDKYMWLDDKGNVLQNGGDTFDVVSEGNANYQVEISNDYCSTTIMLQVISAEFTSDDIQNIMTPNGDGFNDTWKLPTGFVASGDEVIILNRQGSIVYKSSNYNDEWAGTLNDGPALPAATYYYVIRRKGKEPIMGSITIFR